MAMVALAGVASDAARALSTDMIGQRYATDMFPGFDSDGTGIKPSVKVPRWFHFINGPKMTNAAEQLAWCEECERDESWGTARRAYDALVREWPTAPEAPKAQERLAELELKDLDYDNAMWEYRYLLDFYSSQCDYDAVVRRMYEIAELMRAEGKRVFFVRFDNTVDVRRAYESVVLRAPGADFVPQALLTIAALREDEGKPEKAVEVYENLRNVYPGSEEAAQALLEESRVRMQLLDELGYNRERVRDTISFLRLALCGEIKSAEIRHQLSDYLAAAETLQEDAAWQAARFYDSVTRTRRSAIRAYESYLGEYSGGRHADEAAQRLKALKEEAK